MNESEEEREQERSSEESEQNLRYEFDPEFLRELDRAEFAGEERTVEGEILGSEEWTEGEDITLRVSIPLETDGPVEIDVPVPAPDEPLNAAKFGRLLEAHGYSRSQAAHLAGDGVECSYDGSWDIVDPDPPEDEPSESPNVADPDSAELEASKAQGAVNAGFGEPTTGSRTHTSEGSERTRYHRAKIRRYGLYFASGLIIPYLLSDVVPSLLRLSPETEAQINVILNFTQVLPPVIVVISLIGLALHLFGFMSAHPETV